MSEDVEKQARELGWQPKEEFKGNPDNWVEASEYVARGERVIPYLQADRRKLLGRVSAYEQQVTALSSSLEETRRELADIRASTSAASAERAKAEINDLRRQLREARSEDDYYRVDELEEKIAEKREAAKGVASTSTATTDRATQTSRPPATGLSPEVQEFIAENRWWTEDPKMRAVATALSQQYQTDAEFLTLSPRDRLKRVAEETQEMFRRERPPAKVGTGNSSTSSRAQPGAHTYENLPDDARSACDKMSSRFVGEGKTHKTIQEWRKYYAENYDWR